MMSAQRLRFWLEAAAATLTGAAGALTLVWPDWLEALTGVSPDRHSGSLEWLVVGGLVGVTVTLVGLARAEARRTIGVAR
jgi:hypothetical protein